MIDAPNTQPAPRTRTADHGSRQQMQRMQERAGVALVLLAAVILEALPVTVWLLFLAAANGVPDDPALPFWWMCLLILGAWGLADALRRAPSEGTRAPVRATALKIAVGVGWALTVAASLLLSPATYFGVPMDRLLPTIATDLETGSDHVGVAVALAVLVAYLWWRGLLLGRLPLTQHRLYSRFIAGLAAIVLAIASAAAVSGPSRHTLGGMLAFLLPVDVFIGLVGLSLAHLLDALEEQRRRRLRGQAAGGPMLVVTRAWIVTALGISGGVVVIALLLALLVSYDSVQALAQALQPLGDAIMTVLTWIIEAVAFLLFLLLNPLVSWLHDRAQSAHPQPQPTPNPGTKPPVNPHPQPVVALPAEWLALGRWVLLALFIVVIAVVLARVLRRFGEWRHPQEFEEERETLDISNLLSRQLRDLAHRLFPHRRAAAADLEALPAGSVRLLYREALQAAAQAGYARARSETPDEYAARLRAAADAMPTSNHLLEPDEPDTNAELALAVLTEAYGMARYGATAGAEAAEEATPAVTTAQRTVLSWLHALSARRDDGAHEPVSQPNRGGG